MQFTNTRQDTPAKDTRSETLTFSLIFRNINVDSHDEKLLARDLGFFQRLRRSKDADARMINLDVE